MTEVNIVALETQNNGRDWPLIVSAIACEVCGVGVGERCIEVGSRNTSNPLCATGTLRADWHAKRKYAAAELWYTQKNLEAQQSSPPNEQPEAVSDRMGSLPTNERATGANPSNENKREHRRTRKKTS